MRETTLRMARQNSRGGDSLALDKLQLDDYYTVGIELDKALSNPGSDYDMVLREGDRLVIPEYVSTVSISGEVMYPNTVLYMAGKHLKYYIGQAGGYGLRAKRSKAYVIYMNGHGVPREEPSQGAHRAGVRDRHPLEARAQGHEPPGDHEPGHVGGVDRNDGGVDREPVEISGKDDGRDEQSEPPLRGMVRSTWRSWRASCGPDAGGSSDGASRGRWRDSSSASASPRSTRLR